MKRNLFARLVCALMVCCTITLSLGANMRVRPIQSPRPETMVISARTSPVRTKPSVTPKSEAIEISHTDAVLIAKTLYGEYRGEDKLQQAAVAWCILNRADHYGQSVESVVTAPNQFSGYSENNPVDNGLYNMAKDVLYRHALEKQGNQNVGRILPKEYMWFSGDGRVNHFRNSYLSGDFWNWSLKNPYIEV